MLGLGRVGRFALGCLALAFGTAARAEEKPVPPLVFTGIPDQDESRLVERFSKVATHLEAKLGVPVRYIPVKSYPAAVTAFTNGQVQLAWFGGFTGVQARRAVPGSQAIAQGAEDAAFKTYLIAHAGAGLEPAKDFPKAIADKTFTFGARASTSGRLMPEYFIRQAFPGKNPEQVFSRVGFSGDHSRTIQLVQSGAFAVGAVDYAVWDLDTKAGKVDRQAVSVIWESPTFPDYQWTVRGDVEQTYGAGFTETLKGALVGIIDPAILEPFGRSKFIPVTNAAYEPLVEVGRATGLLDYLLYRWELILRESAIFGILGVTTLGFYVDAAISELRLDVAVVLIAATAGMTVAVDALSRGLRRSLRIDTLPTRLSGPAPVAGAPGGG